MFTVNLSLEAAAALACLFMKAQELSDKIADTKKIIDITLIFIMPFLFWNWLTFVRLTKVSGFLKSA